MKRSRNFKLAAFSFHFSICFVGVSVECPICGLVPRDRIYLCEDLERPHPICRACYEEMEADATPGWFSGVPGLECPECDAPYKRPNPKRAFALEAKIEAMTGIRQSCLYKKRGCDFAGNRGQLRLHEEAECTWRPRKCPIHGCFEVLYGEDGVREHLGRLHDVRAVQRTGDNQLKIRLSVDPDLRRIRVRGVSGATREGFGDVVLSWTTPSGLNVYSVVWLEPPCIVLWQRLKSETQRAKAAN